MNLSNFLVQTVSFVDIDAKLPQINEGISFWGYRYIYLDKESDYNSIHVLADRVMELMKKAKFEYTDTERAAGKVLAGRIDRLFALNDARLSNAWLITRIACYLRENTFRQGYTTRFHWQLDKNFFSYYTASQFKNHFNRDPSLVHSSTAHTDTDCVLLYQN